MADSPILIAGGGIAGLATSLGLAKIGRQSHVLEKSRIFETVGAGLQLGPNAVRALQYLGAWDGVAPHCCSPEEIHILDGLTGKIWKRIKLGKEFERRFGAPYRICHRADLQAGLLANVRASSAIELQSNAEVVDASIEETSLTLRNGQTMKAPAILAADGIHSVIRNKIGDGPAPDNSGHTLFRALLPMHAVPAGIEANVVSLWLYPGGHVVHYAVSNGAQFNIVATVGTQGITPDTLFKSACSPLAGILRAPENWLAWPALDLAPRTTWSRNNICLIGDAAHASLPYLAQGAAMSLEDAWVLSACMQANPDSSSAFESFAAKRAPRTRAVQIRSRWLGNIYHAQGLARLLTGMALRAQPSHMFLKQLSWLYQWDV